MSGKHEKWLASPVSNPSFIIIDYAESTKRRWGERVQGIWRIRKGCDTQEVTCKLTEEVSVGFLSQQVFKCYVHQMGNKSSIISIFV